MIELNKQGLLGDLRDVKLPICEKCVIEKTKRVKFAKCVSATRDELSYVHWFMGAAQNPSLSGSKYFVLFIYDYSRRTCIYPLKMMRYLRNSSFGRSRLSYKLVRKLSTLKQTMDLNIIMKASTNLHGMWYNKT